MAGQIVSRYIRRSPVIGVVTLALAGGLAFAAQAAPLSREAPPPDATTLQQTTNAMLDAADVNAILGRDARLERGYLIPPGGQDPAPVCQTSDRKAVLPDSTLVVGYRATADGLSQQVYAYPSASAAQDAWTGLNADVARKCAYLRVDDDGRYKVSTGTMTVGSTEGRWIRTDSTVKDVGGSFTTIALADNGISILTREVSSSATTSGERIALQELTDVLADRYGGRVSRSLTQPALLTAAEQVMLTRADLPSTLPVRSPARGAWARFDTSFPGDEMFLSCSPSGFGDVPSGLASFEMSMGDTGGPTLVGGYASQDLDTYASAAEASAAWTKLVKYLRGCREREGTLLSRKQTARRVDVGVSPVVINGVPGVWVRSFETEPNYGSTCSTTSGKVVPCGKWSTKLYTLYLMDGATIQTFSYGSTLTGLRQVPLDQGAVNDLAVNLLAKWNAATQAS